ncbi:MAG TPA: 3-hydroxyacyl-CoA dehydrogenase NAD-binding domain-containing protein [Myxococcota bacterium]|nr:3-hydroxyacyl-CoA dehydrogenase NAD-binding domain-containing protein [Myxococcota bacterium]
MTRVFIAGAGTMGTQIAALCAKAELSVVVYDSDAGALARIAGRFETTPSLDAAAAADVVSESIIEDLGAKRRFWAALSPIVRADTLLTTNTSTLLPSELADAVAGPERFLAWHFHPPVERNRLVDVMGHAETSPAAVAAIAELTRRLGHEPLVIAKEHREYVFNSMLIAMLTAAQELAVDEVASIDDIDRAWCTATGMELGPFAIMDLIGLDTLARIVDVGLQRNPNDKRLRRLLAWMKPKLAKGELGMKSGQGFYRYS